MRWTHVVIATFMIFAGLTSIGCSSAQTLRSEADVEPFVKDAARGDHASWKLAAGASRQATRAWHDKRRIEEVGSGLRAWPDWGCKGVGMLAAGAEDVVAALSVERDGASVITVNLLLPAADELPRAELGDMLKAVCSQAQ